MTPLEAAKKIYAESQILTNHEPRSVCFTHSDCGHSEENGCYLRDGQCDIISAAQYRQFEYEQLLEKYAPVIAVAYLKLKEEE